MIIKSIATALVASATMLGTGAANAGGHVSWTIGINAPLVGAVIGNAPYYVSAPVYVQAPPVYVAPQPVYESLPAPVYYPQVRYPQVRYPRVGYYRPEPVVYSYPRGHREWREGHRDGDRYDDHRHDDHRSDDHRH